jgi:hypothetical protein
MTRSLARVVRFPALALAAFAVSCSESFPQDVNVGTLDQILIEDARVIAVILDDRQVDPAFNGTVPANDAVIASTRTWYDVSCWHRARAADATFGAWKLIPGTRDDTLENFVAIHGERRGLDERRIDSMLPVRLVSADELSR